MFPTLLHCPRRILGPVPVPPGANFRKAVVYLSRALRGVNIFSVCFRESRRTDREKFRIPGRHFFRKAQPSETPHGRRPCFGLDITNSYNGYREHYLNWMLSTFRTQVGEILSFGI